MKKYLDTKSEIFKADIEPAREEIITEAMKQGDRRFAHLVKDEFISKPYRALLYSGIVWIWCNFEMYMKDLWETTLNIAGRRAIKDVLKNISKEKGGSDKGLIVGKSITLDYLAKFNYNLSNKLGTVLINKFDFNSLSGIKEAYSSAFPKSTTIKNLLANKVLIEVEARRNVIAHRSGLIDAEYCKKTGTNKSKIGKSLDISSRVVEDYDYTLNEIGADILLAIKSIVSATS